MMAVTALFLADRNVIDFDATVASYWPAFAQGGKGDIRVSQVMAHSAGLSGWKEPMAPVDLYDWEKATTLLARQEPFWAPGTASGYHGLTQGFLVGEVVRRATGEMLGDIFRREIAEPLGADFHLGLEAQHDPRVAELTERPMPESASEPSALLKNMLFNPLHLVDVTRTRAWRAAHFYAGNGHGNARAIARIHALIANGGELDGKRLLSEAACRQALEPQIEGVDLVLSQPARFGLGFGLPGPWLPAPHPDCLFWTGAGGALAFIDLTSRLSVGYTMNRMGGEMLVDPRAHDLLQATLDALRP